MERPDLSQADPALRAYVEHLEAQLAQLRAERADGSEPEPGEPLPPLEPSEPPTSLNLITLSRAGLAKRVARHLYTRQRRGGMGLLDLETDDDDPPAGLVIADERAHLLIITTQARAFRLPVYFLNEAPAIRARPQPFLESLNLSPSETWAAALPAQTQGYLAVASVNGHVRVWPAHLFGESGRVGASVLRLDETGAPAAACWATGDSDLFLATRRGLGARFPVKSVPAQGAVGLRLEPDDALVAITAVRPENGVFLLGADGRGTIRLMSGFNANKAPGVSGKLALKADAVVGAVAVGDGDDLFILSRLAKIIRFKADEIPAKEGVVQGVICMSLRGDQCLTAVIGHRPPAAGGPA
jgi:DNA gyrase subunit A